MAMSVTYTTVAGMLMMENRGGVETEYNSDPLGNLIQCRDMNGNKTYEAWYWSYGEIREETGTNPSPWGFVGLLGYYTDALNFLYVRARYYRPNLTRWQTVDPLWPEEPSYGYAAASPVCNTDEDGQKPKKCPNGYKLVRITCYGNNDAISPHAGDPVAYSFMKECGGCKKRWPRAGDCASASHHSSVCPPGQIVTILAPDAGHVIHCRICDTGNGHTGTLDIFIPLPDHECGKRWKTGYYCLKCGY